MEGAAVPVRATLLGHPPWQGSLVTEIGITEFEATGTAVFERVRKTRQPVVVTRFGQPVARIVPLPPPERPPERPLERKDRFGCLKGTAEIRGDLVAPVFDSSD